MEVKYTRISAPSKIESFKLRIMIVAGVISLVFFISEVFAPANKGYGILYIALCITLVYMCLKYLHEWYHYFKISAPPVLMETGKYSVDIFTTFCAGEPYDMLERTLAGIASIRYPHTALVLR